MTTDESAVEICLMRRTVIAGCALGLWVAVAGAQSPQIRIGGAVERPLALTQEEVAALPHESLTASAHDQAGEYSGVPLAELLKRAGVASGDALRGREVAKYVVVTGADGYRAVFALAELDASFTDRTVILADRRDGKPLPPNAAPFQVIATADRRPARWVRQVVAIEVFDAARAGDPKQSR